MNGWMLWRDCWTWKRKIIDKKKKKTWITGTNLCWVNQKKKKYFYLWELCIYPLGECFLLHQVMFICGQEEENKKRGFYLTLEFIMVYFIGPWSLKKKFKEKKKKGRWPQLSLANSLHSIKAPAWNKSAHEDEIQTAIRKSLALLLLLKWILPMHNSCGAKKKC